MSPLNSFIRISFLRSQKETASSSLKKQTWKGKDLLGIFVNGSILLDLLPFLQGKQACIVKVCKSARVFFGGDTSVITSYNSFKETVRPSSFPSKSLAHYKSAAGIMGGNLTF